MTGHTYLTLLRDIKETLMYVEQHAPGYDWNADPLSLTLKTGKIYAQIDAALAHPIPPVGSVDSAGVIRRLADITDHLTRIDSNSKALTVWISAEDAKWLIERAALTAGTEPSTEAADQTLSEKAIAALSDQSNLISSQAETIARLEKELATWKWADGAKGKQILEFSGAINEQAETIRKLREALERCQKVCLQTGSHRAAEILLICEEALASTEGEE